MIDNKVEAIKANVEEIMKILGIEKTESNENTPLRIAKMWVNELFRNRNDLHIGELDATMKVFDNVDNLTDMVIMEDIEYHSMCEHHWLPFMGTMRVGYVPNKGIIGLSKIPRVVKFFSQKPQLQERLVKEITEYLYDVIRPKYIIVEAVATHACVMCRGAESNSKTNTMYSKAHVHITEEQIKEYKSEFFSRRGDNANIEC